MTARPASPETDDDKPRARKRDNDPGMFVNYEVQEPYLRGYRPAASWRGWFGRWLLMVFLVFITYNPSGYSYWHWVTGPITTQVSFEVAVGVVLFVVFVAIGRMVYCALHVPGLILATALYASGAWVLAEYRFIVLSQPGTRYLVIMIGVAVVLGIGLVWSHIHRRFTGVRDVLKIPP